MFGSREAGLGRVSRVWSMSFGERRIKKGFLSMIWSWIFIDTSVKERVNFLIVGSRELRAQTYILTSIDRWSFGERRTKKGYSPIVWNWIFMDTSVNFDVYHRVFGRRLGVDSSFTSGACVRTTTTFTPSATIKTSRRTVAVERTRKASHSFVCQQ